MGKNKVSDKGISWSIYRMKVIIECRELTEYRQQVIKDDETIQNQIIVYDEMRS